MGTASAVADALRYALAQAARLPVVDDQHALTLCMLAAPPLHRLLLTLDYAGRIALALGGIDLRRALALRGSGAGSRRRVHNTRTGISPCALHFSGPAKPSLRQWARA